MASSRTRSISRRTPVTSPTFSGLSLSLMDESHVCRFKSCFSFLELDDLARALLVTPDQRFFKRSLGLALSSRQDPVLPRHAPGKLALLVFVQFGEAP